MQVRGSSSYGHHGAHTSSYGHHGAHTRHVSWCIFREHPAKTWDVSSPSATQHERSTGTGTGTTNETHGCRQDAWALSHRVGAHPEFFEGAELFAMVEVHADRDVEPARHFHGTCPRQTRLLADHWRDASHVQPLAGPISSTQDLSRGSPQAQAQAQAQAHAHTVWVDSASCTAKP